jgi:iron uptake system component EfeO
MLNMTGVFDIEPGPISPPAGPSTRRRQVLVAGGAVLAAGAVIAGVLTAGSSGHSRAQHAAVTSDGLPHTSVEVSPSACGHGWSHPKTGQQVFDLRNTSSAASEVDLTDPRTGAVYGEIEGLAPGTARPMQVTLGNGTYAFKCLPDDADAVTGPTVRVTGATGKSGPAAVPVTQQDLIPLTLSYQKWIQARTVELAKKTEALSAAIDRGDLRAARAAWLSAHLVYERMGAAYGTFGAADKAINGTTAGLSGGVHDTRFTGFHRIEYGLWHSEPAGSLRGPADRLVKDVRALRDNWPQQRMDPAVLGLRAHEILENTMQSELTGRTDYGSGTNLATARANLDGTRVLLGCLRPLLKTRDAGLTLLDSSLNRTQQTLDEQQHDGRWTPVAQLDRTRRERVNSAVGALLEQLADVATLTDVRRTA